MKDLGCFLQNLGMERILFCIFFLWKVLISLIQIIVFARIGSSVGFRIWIIKIMKDFTIFMVELKIIRIEN